VIRSSREQSLNTGYSLEDLYMRFYSTFFQELETSYLRLYLSEIREDKMTVEEGLLEIIGQFKEASHYIW
jgi:hypothetical protein